MKILKSKQVGSNFNVVVDIDGEQLTLTRKKSSFASPEEFEKLKDMCKKLTEVKNPETKTAIKLANDIYTKMTPVTTETKAKVEKAKDEVKAAKKATRKSEESQSKEIAIVKKTNASLKDMILTIQEKLNNGEATDEEKELIASLMPKQQEVQKSLPATTTTSAPRRGEH
jgi:Mg2+ and Co2+ transporter CorA